MGTLLTGLKSLFFPPTCAFCGQPCGTSYYCGRCALPLTNEKRALTGVDVLYVPFAYTGGARHAILGLKKQRIRDYCLPLARFMCERMEQDGFDGCDLVTCVPIGSNSGFEREFNQSRLLAEYIARHFGIPFAETLRRVSDTVHQKELSAEERAEQISGKFEPLGGKLPAGGRLLLVDDVLTTGATVCEAASVLRKAGANRISVCCAAIVKRQNAAPRITERNSEEL